MKTKQLMKPSSSILLKTIILLVIGNMLVTGCGSWKKSKSEYVERHRIQGYHKDTLAQVSNTKENTVLYKWLQSSAFSTAIILADSNLTIHPDKGIQLNKGSVVYLQSSQHEKQQVAEQHIDNEDRITQVRDDSYHQIEEIENNVHQQSRHPPNKLIWLGFFCCLLTLIIICYWKIEKIR